ncbi:MAG: hypothetical protein M1827_006165 [Pycnora praestabilis]|nr:MAG: hypothetical protein M1827_006165 [Pycnora praestabilis]
MSKSTDDDDGPEPFHVLDLPQIYTKPPAESLLNILALCASKPQSWDGKEDPIPKGIRTVNPDGLTKYLTSIIASRLQWVEDDDTKDKVWELASVRLSERSGRTAMPAVSRTFSIPTKTIPFEITLHEPSLTADNLGLKTWASAYLLSKRLHLFCPPPIIQWPRPTILELGSGTGLVGIAAATIWGASAYLTDLPEIMPNLASNVSANLKAISSTGGTATTGILDWSDTITPSSPPHTYQTILAADPLYSPQHPGLLVQTITKYLIKNSSGRVIIELPLRDAYMPEIADLRERMQGAGLKIMDQGEESGFDDWGGGVEGGLREVSCWWGVWIWSQEKERERELKEE